MLRNSVPGSIAVTGEPPSLQALLVALQHIQGLEFLRGSGSVVVTGIRPANLLFGRDLMEVGVNVTA